MPSFREALQYFLHETRPTWLNIDTGEIRFDELAKAVEEWLVALPVERRMEAMRMIPVHIDRDGESSYDGAALPSSVLDDLWTVLND